MEITKKIILNTNNDRPNSRVIIKQGSIGTITLVVTINDKGGVLTLPTGTTAKVRMLKHDKKQVLNDCTVSGNNVHVSITQQMQAVAGDGQCEVILFNGAKTFTTASFPITIEANVHDDSQIESTPEYNTLVNSLIRIEGAIPQAEEAYRVAQEAESTLETLLETEEAITLFEVYNPSTEYIAGNKVSYEGSSHVNILGGTGFLPTDTDHWLLMAKKGDKGDKGNKGDKGDKGDEFLYTDFTPEQLLALKGEKGTDGIDGADGISPTVTVNTNTGTTYTLDITDENGTITTPNLKGADGTGAGDMTSDVYDPQGKAIDVFDYADTHDTKDNITTFTEAEEDVDIVTGEKHSTIFGKILKSIKTLRHNIGVLASEKIDKSSIIQTDTISDATKVPSTVVTNALGQEIDTLNNNLASHKAENAQDAHGLVYEEGIFTPNLLFGGNSEGMAYTRQDGRYTRVGRNVHFEIGIGLTNKGTLTGNVTISGLPFVSNSANPARAYIVDSSQMIFPTNSKHVDAYIAPNSAIINNLRGVNDNTSVSVLSDANFKNNTVLNINGVYSVYEGIK